MELTHEFAPEIEKVLREAGWFPGRLVSDEVLDSWLIINWNPLNSCPHGYSKIFPIAWRTLREFGGLTIEPFRVCRDPMVAKFIIDPLLLAEYELDNDWNVNEWLFGETLFPIGVWLGEPSYCAIAMNTNGRVFLTSEVGYIMGNTMEEALTKLIYGDFSCVMGASKNLDISHIAYKIIDRIEEREMMKGEWNY